jgi:hypothetical protein
MNSSTKGGIHIGSAGNVNMSAGGDIVGGNKVTTFNGFRQDDDKQKFLQQIEELRATLRDLQAVIR